MQASGKLLDGSSEGWDTHTLIENKERYLQLSREDVAYLKREWGDDISLVDRGDEQLITVTNTVGVIGLPSGGILSVEPKVETSLLYMLAYVGRVSEKIVRDKNPAAIESGDSLTELLGRLFLTEVEHLHRRGLDQEYQSTEDTQRHVRGQIQVHKQLQRQGPVPTQFECRYQDRTPDIPINQVLLTTIGVLLPLLSDPSLRARLQQARARFETAVSPSAQPLQALEQISLSRLNDHYRAALLLAQAILEQEFLHDTGKSSRPFPSMVFPMPDVFEEAVQQAVEALLDDTPYTMTKKDLGTVARRIGPDQNDTRDLEPDIVIRRKTQSDDKGPVVAVGDVKWKTDEKPSSGDFYQLATYQGYADVPGIVVYPEKETVEHDLEYVSTDSASNRGNLLIRTIDISSSDSYKSFIDQLIASLSEPVTQLLTYTELQAKRAKSRD